MMGFYGNNMMFGGNFGLVGLFFVLFWAFAFVDVVLLAVWLWKQINKK